MFVAWVGKGAGGETGGVILSIASACCTRRCRSRAICYIFQLNAPPPLWLNTLNPYERKVVLLLPPPLFGVANGVATHSAVETRRPCSIVS